MGTPVGPPVPGTLKDIESQVQLPKITFGEPELKAQNTEHESKMANLAYSGPPSRGHVIGTINGDPRGTPRPRNLKRYWKTTPTSKFHLWGVRL